MPRGAATCRRRRRYTACCHKDYFTTSCQSRLAFPLSLIIWKSKFRAFLNSGLSEPGGAGGLPPHILADQLIIFHQGRRVIDVNDLRLSFHCYILIPRKCPHKNPLKTQCPPGFINLPTILFLLRLHLHLTNPIFLAQGSLVLPSCMPLLFFCAFLILLLLHACSFCSMAPNPWSSLNPSQ